MSQSLPDQSRRAEFMRVMDFLERNEFWVTDKKYDDVAFHGGHIQGALADDYAASDEQSAKEGT